MAKTLFLFITFFLLSCQVKTPKKIHVAVLLESSTNPFSALMWEGIKSEADRISLSVELFWPENESQFMYQIGFLKNHAAEYDAFIIAPTSVQKLANVLPELKRANKKVIILDKEIPVPPKSAHSLYYDAFIGTNNEEGGKLAAMYAYLYLKPDSKITIVSGFERENSRTVYFKNTIRSKFPKISIQEFSGEFDKEKTRKTVQKNLSTFQESSVIFCENDFMALGVIKELSIQSIQKTTGKRPVIIGYDSIRDAQEAILKGSLAASVSQFPSQMGSESVKTLIRLMKNEPVSSRLFISPVLSVRRSIIQAVDLASVGSLKRGTHD